MSGGEIRRIGAFPAGQVVPPPSKSLSHRALICAGLAALFGPPGESRLENMGTSQDVDATLGALRALGADFKREGDAVLCRPGPGAAPGDLVLDCGESGSTLRFLIPVAALLGREVAFTGRGRLLARPLAPYAGAFSRAGVSFSPEAGTVRVQGPLPGGVYDLPGDVSSQFVSGLLLALPLTGGDSEIHLAGPLESAPYVDMTLEVMAAFGVQAQWEDLMFRVRGNQKYRPARYRVEGDWSQAAFFLAAAALGRPVTVAGLPPGSRQGDAAFLGILQAMGARVEETPGGLAVQAGALKAVEVDARAIPDLVPPLAALCCFCRGTSRIVNAGRLRLKESDRLHALARELNAIGARVEEGEDFLSITGRAALPGGRADAHNDHRIAMALAVAAIGCEGPVELSGWESVQKSYPHFWRDFEREARP